MVRYLIIIDLLFAVVLFWSRRCSIAGHVQMVAKTVGRGARARNDIHEVSEHARWSNRAAECSGDHELETAWTIDNHYLETWKGRVGHDAWSFSGCIGAREVQ
jgi:hypothetical protein